MDTNSKWITQSEAAERLGLSKRRVLEYCTAGMITTNPPNGRSGGGVAARTLLRSDVEKLVEKRKKKAQTAEMRALQKCDRSKVITAYADANFSANQPGTRIDLSTVTSKTEAALFVLCKWVTLEQASQLVGLSRRLLRSRILSGKLPALRDDTPAAEAGEKAQPGDCWRVKVSDLEAIAGELYGTSAESSASLGA